MIPELRRSLARASPSSRNAVYACGSLPGRRGSCGLTWAEVSDRAICWWRSLAGRFPLCSLRDRLTASRNRTVQYRRSSACQRPDHPLAAASVRTGCCQVALSPSPDDHLSAKLRRGRACTFGETVRAGKPFSVVRCDWRVLFVLLAPCGTRVASLSVPLVPSLKLAPRLSTRHN